MYQSLLSTFTLESGFFQLCLLECLANVSIIVEHVHAGVRILSAMDFGARSCCVSTHKLLLKWSYGVAEVLCKYHHSTKLISQVCCHLYCYECAARVTMPAATNDIFSGIAWYYGKVLSYELSISLHVQMQCTWLVVPDTDSCMTCSTDTDSRVTCVKNTAFYKWRAAARLPHWLQYIWHELDICYSSEKFNLPESRLSLVQSLTN